MTHPFTGRATAIVANQDHGDICNPRDVVRAQTQVIILEIQEVTRIESAQRFQYVRSKQHETTADDCRIPDDIGRIDDISHLVACQAPRECVPNASGHESSHEEVK
ncbi:hypothetical protein X989_3343 [Burkholderia pseudomallei MSHR4378]|nr:hypothetical protein X989_3343 [Burkholderia pseudomallei MSHR4378]